MYIYPRAWLQKKQYITYVYEIEDWSECRDQVQVLAICSNPLLCIATYYMDSILDGRKLVYLVLFFLL